MDSNSQACVCNLSPLPSPSSSSWFVIKDSQPDSSSVSFNHQRPALSHLLALSLSKEVSSSGVDQDTITDPGPMPCHAFALSGRQRHISSGKPVSNPTSAPMEDFVSLSQEDLFIIDEMQSPSSVVAGPPSTLHPGPSPHSDLKFQCLHLSGDSSGGAPSSSGPSSEFTVPLAVLTPSTKAVSHTGTPPFIVQEDKSDPSPSHLPSTQQLDVHADSSMALILSNDPLQSNDLHGNRKFLASSLQGVETSTPPPAIDELAYMQSSFRLYLSQSLSLGYDNTTPVKNQSSLATRNIPTSVPDVDPCTPHHLAYCLSNSALTGLGSFGIGLGPGLELTNEHLGEVVAATKLHYPSLSPSCSNRPVATCSSLLDVSLSKLDMAVGSPQHEQPPSPILHGCLAGSSCADVCTHPVLSVQVATDDRTACSDRTESISSQEYVVVCKSTPFIADKMACNYQEEMCLQKLASSLGGNPKLDHNPSNSPTGASSHETAPLEIVCSSLDGASSDEGTESAHAEMLHPGESSPPYPGDGCEGVQRPKETEPLTSDMVGRPGEPRLLPGALSDASFVEQLCFARTGFESVAVGVSNVSTHSLYQAEGSTPLFIQSQSTMDLSSQLASERSDLALYPCPVDTQGHFGSPTRLESHSVEVPAAGDHSSDTTVVPSVQPGSLPLTSMARGGGGLDKVHLGFSQDLLEPTSELEIICHPQLRLSSFGPVGSPSGSRVLDGSLTPQAGGVVKKGMPPAQGFHLEDTQSKLDSLKQVSRPVENLLQEVGQLPEKMDTERAGNQAHVPGPAPPLLTTDPVVLDEGPHKFTAATASRTTSTKSSATKEPGDRPDEPVQRIVKTVRTQTKLTREVTKVTEIMMLSDSGKVLKSSVQTEVLPATTESFEHFEVMESKNSLPDRPSIIPILSCTSSKPDDHTSHISTATLAKRTSDIPPNPHTERVSDIPLQDHCSSPSTAESRIRSLEATTPKRHPFKQLPSARKRRRPSTPRRIMEEVDQGLSENPLLGTRHILSIQNNLLPDGVCADDRTACSVSAASSQPSQSWSAGLVGVRVFCKWPDSHWYPAVVSSYNRCAQCFIVLFDDGDQTVCRDPSSFLPCVPFPVDLPLLFRNRRGWCYPGKLLDSVHETSGQVIYRVAGRKGPPVQVSAGNLVLNQDSMDFLSTHHFDNEAAWVEALRLRGVAAQYSTPVPPKPIDRRECSPQNKKRMCLVVGPDEENCDETVSLSPEFLPPQEPNPSLRSPRLKRSQRLTTTSPRILRTPGRAASVIFPEIKEHSVGFFAGIKFLVTRGDDGPLLDENQEASPVNREELEGLISSSGGHVLNSVFDKGFSVGNSSVHFLISDTPRRTIKYLFALASGWPCLRYQWVQDCHRVGRLLEYKPYLLPSGTSLLDGRLHPWQPVTNLLNGLKVFVYAEKKLQRSWAAIIEAGGGEVLSRFPHVSGISGCVSSSQSLPCCDLVLVKGVRLPMGILNRALSAGVPVLTQDWLVETLVVHQRSSLSEPSFQYNGLP